MMWRPIFILVLYIAMTLSKKRTTVDPNFLAGTPSNFKSFKFTTEKKELLPLVGEDFSQAGSTVIAGLMPDTFGEMFNFLDGDSFGIDANPSRPLAEPFLNDMIAIMTSSTVASGVRSDGCGSDGSGGAEGPMHEFVYGWQAIVNTMSVKNNVEVRKRAGLQRFALAGINGISLISHIGVTEIMINGTRSYCFGGVSRPPGKRNVICKGAMYQEGRFSCQVPYLRFPTALGYRYCIDQYATVDTLDGTYKKTYCALGQDVPKFHYDYICERRDIKLRRFNISDPNERFNIRNPVVRRAEYYRAPYDILKSCPDWYGCKISISPEASHQQVPEALNEYLGNNTAFVGHGGKYWLALYYAKLATYATYFQAHAEYPWESNRPINSMNKGGIWEQLMKANIGPDMNLHYNLNGIYSRYTGGAIAPDLMRNEGQVQPANFRSDVRDGGPGSEDLFMDKIHSDGTGSDQVSPPRFLHESQVQPKFDGRNM